MSQSSSLVFTSSLGRLRISVNDDAITEVSFLEDTVLIHSPDTVQNIHPLLRECHLELSAFFAGTLSSFTVPIRQDGTEFQQKVWIELQKIPYGKTITYLELSKRIGDAKAIRAVGTTNGKNKIAIIVPCHRVIGSNGSLTGYAGGLGKKQWLLEHEMKVMHGVQTLF